MRKYTEETNVKNVASRIWDKVKKAGRLAAEILDPGSHNIDNPENKKYYEKPEYWEVREEAERNTGKFTPPEDKGFEL